jgi:predicted ATPase
MLLDRGLLGREGSVYSPTGPIESLEVPETLHGLIAARLDGLSPEERRVVQDGAVLGKTFFKQGIARVSGLPEEEVEPILSSLVRKEVVSLQADPRSPERGQYGFLQDLVRKVAYDTLSKKDRKAKHLAAAAFIEESWSGEEEEVVEVLTPVQAFAELDRLVCEVAGRELFDLRLERIGELDVFLEPFALSAFAERPELFDDGQVRTPR